MGQYFAAPPVVNTDPIVPEVITDPVPFPYSNNIWRILPDLFPYNPIETGGSGLVGHYVGTSPNIRYIPAFQYQLIYSDPQGGYSCTAYAMAMAIDKATYGGSEVTGRQVRALSGAASFTGLNLPDVIRAANRLYVTVIYPTGTWANLITSLRNGHGVVLQGDYEVIPDAYSGQTSFDGNHAVYIDYLHSTGLYMYVMDPLQKKGPTMGPYLHHAPVC